MMNLFFQVAKKTVAILGFTIFVNTLTVILFFNISFRRDDPYIIGFLPAMLILPGWILYFIFERYPKRFLNQNSAFLCYSPFPLVFFIIPGVLVRGEGSGYMFLFGVYFVAGVLLSLPVLKQMEKQSVVYVLIAFGLIYLLGFVLSIWL